ncbi:hypothetical protein QAA18_07210 [Luteimonas sp. 8-5]|uniref:hypothetical protein n=1 Tax=Luteimonas sp. 8-5 TaxID=3039387 RepID=UPI0024367C72|nr:hypothetical protein [Luteimonas sp. 8-5]MDG6348532.1 hypothetical protein [Luteimonas sp. 8-5]
MLIRAAIVLLLVLNLGVAAWWVLHDAPPAPAVPQPSGVPRLQLLDESTQADDDTPGNQAPAATSSAAPAAPGACRGPAGQGTNWRVYLPDLESAEAAQAMAARIGAAGFSDFLVMREGDASSIALGLFSTLDGAQRRVDALQAAGFPARCARIAASTPA